MSIEHMTEGRDFYAFCTGIRFSSHSLLTTTDTSFPQDTESLQLLRHSISDRIVAYPQTILETLVWLDCKQEALALTELIIDPSERAEKLCAITKQLRRRGNGKQECLRLLALAQKLVDSAPSNRRNSAAREHLVDELTQWQQWRRAEAVASTIEGDWQRGQAISALFSGLLEGQQWDRAASIAFSTDHGKPWMLGALCSKLARMRQWEFAEKIAASIENSSVKVSALGALGHELTAASFFERAETIWKQALEAADIYDTTFGDLEELSEVLAKSHQWERAELVARSIVFPNHASYPFTQKGRSEEQARARYERIALRWALVDRAQALAIIACELTKAQRWEHAATLWNEALATARSCKNPWSRAEALGRLTLALAEAQQWEHANAIWIEAEEARHRVRLLSYHFPNELDTITDEEEDVAYAYDIEIEQQCLKVLKPLCRKLVRAQRWEQALKLCHTLEKADMKIEVLTAIANELDQAQQEDQSQGVWSEAVELALSTKQGWYTLWKLAKALQQAQQWEYAGTVWTATVAALLVAEQGEEKDGSSINYGRVALELAMAQHYEEARMMLTEAMSLIHKEIPLATIPEWLEEA